MVQAIAIHGSATIDGRQEKRPPAPSETRQGGIYRAVVWSPAAAIVRHTRACSPPPGPHPGPGCRRCHPPLPPARSESHPPCPIFRPRSSYSSPPPGVPQASLPPPPPPDGYNNADNQRSLDAVRDRLPEDDRLRATQSASLLSPLPRAGGCVRGAEHQRPVTPRIVQPLGQVPPQGCPSFL